MGRLKGSKNKATDDHLQHILLQKEQELAIKVGLFWQEATGFITKMATEAANNVVTNVIGAVNARNEEITQLIQFCNKQRETNKQFEEKNRMIGLAFTQMVNKVESLASAEKARGLIEKQAKCDHSTVTLTLDSQGYVDDVRCSGCEKRLSVSGNDKPYKRGKWLWRVITGKIIC